MLEVSKEIQIDYGHTLPNHFSFCNQIHGHRARVIATVIGELIDKSKSSEGMLMDFSDIKKLMMEKIHLILDHGFAVWKDDTEELSNIVGDIMPSTLDFIQARNEKVLITDEPPTAECLAKWAFNQLKDYMPEGTILKSITWYETPNSYAIYY